MAQKPITENTLFYGDNLDILRQYIPDECVDLVYLDPPFNSSRSYNVLFKDEHGVESESQITAFEDTWHWNIATEQVYNELVTNAPDRVSKMIESLRGFVGENQMMAYLVMMAVRLVELHRVLKPTGSLYLHCDPTASHYLKIILDTIFGPTHFQNELIWKRTSAHSSAKRYGPVHDILLFYSKSDVFIWNAQHTAFDQEYIASHYRAKDEQGRAFTLSDLTAAGTRNGSSGKPWRGFDPASKGTHWKYKVEGLDVLDAKDAFTGLQMEDGLGIVGILTKYMGCHYRMFGQILIQSMLKQENVWVIPLRSPLHYWSALFKQAVTQAI